MNCQSALSFATKSSQNPLQLKTMREEINYTALRFGMKLPQALRTLEIQEKSS
jgi:hypothetical protein